MHVFNNTERDLKLYLKDTLHPGMTLYAINKKPSNKPKYSISYVDECTVESLEDYYFFVINERNQKDFFEYDMLDRCIYRNKSDALNHCNYLNTRMG